eukprot:gene22647-biopygen5769
MLSTSQTKLKKRGFHFGFSPTTRKVANCFLGFHFYNPPISNKGWSLSSKPLYHERRGEAVAGAAAEPKGVLRRRGPRWRGDAVMMGEAAGDVPASSRSNASDPAPAAVPPCLGETASGRESDADRTRAVQQGMHRKDTQ